MSQMNCQLSKPTQIFFRVPRSNAEPAHSLTTPRPYHNSVGKGRARSLRTQASWYTLVGSSNRSLEGRARRGRRPPTGAGIPSCCFFGEASFPAKEKPTVRRPPRNPRRDPPARATPPPTISPRRDTPAGAFRGVGAGPRAEPFVLDRRRVLFFAAYNERVARSRRTSTRGFLDFRGSRRTPPFDQGSRSRTRTPDFKDQRLTN